jgi:hypothetical protein
MSNEDESPTTTIDVNEAFWSRFDAILDAKLEPLRMDMVRLDKQLSVFTSFFTEDKARIKAKEMFGIYFSKSLHIRSIHQVAKHISKANDSKLPSEHSERNIADATTEVARKIERRTVPLSRLLTPMCSSMMRPSRKSCKKYSCFLTVTVPPSITHRFVG